MSDDNQTDIFTELGMEDDNEKEWHNMPAFDHQDKSPVKQLLVSFASMDDYKEFGRIMNQPLTRNTQSIWYPKAEIETMMDKRYAQEPEPEPARTVQEIMPKNIVKIDEEPIEIATPEPEPEPEPEEINNDEEQTKPMEVVKVKNREFYAIKNEGSEKPFLNNMGECKSIELFPWDVVADIGAYIGEYSTHCIEAGVKKVISYEPTPDTFKVLEKNKLPGMELHNMAVTGMYMKSVELFLSKGVGVTNSIAKSKGKARSVTVPAIRYEEAIKDATVVKIDVEGAEYTYDIIQPNLRAIILEFHPIVGMDWKARAYEIMAELNKSGFNTIIEPTFASGWNLIGSFLRSTTQPADES